MFRNDVARATGPLPLRQFPISRVFGRFDGTPPPVNLNGVTDACGQVPGSESDQKNALRGGPAVAELVDAAVGRIADDVDGGHHTPRVWRRVP